jgi:hypothetical protein
MGPCIPRPPLSPLATAHTFVLLCHHKLGLKQKENPRGPSLRIVSYIQSCNTENGRGVRGEMVIDFGYAVKKELFVKLTPLLIAITIHVSFYKGKVSQRIKVTFKTFVCISSIILY